MSITAEGVETRQQLDHLRANNCDQAQGYFFSKPVPSEDIPELIAKIEAECLGIWRELRAGDEDQHFLMSPLQPLHLSRSKSQS
jgi:predicted signal transduction protein with EAL and GGDEF domain